MFKGSVALLDSTGGINTTNVLVNGRGNRKHLLIDGNLHSSFFGTVRSGESFSLSTLCAVYSFLQFKNFSAIFFCILA